MIEMVLKYFLQLHSKEYCLCSYVATYMHRQLQSGAHKHNTHVNTINTKHKHNVVVISVVAPCV